MNTKFGTIPHDSSFSDLILQHWDDFAARLLLEGQRNVIIDGHQLDISNVVAIARHGGEVQINPDTIDLVSQSERAIITSLTQGSVVYGVNTGFGGSADTRTSALKNLQRLLIRGLHYGVIANEQYSGHISAMQTRLGRTLLQTALPLNHPIEATYMPDSWVRALMLIRLNSLVSGASGVQPSTVESLRNLINCNVLPTIPTRGSISASGDLSPLSYVAGVMQGKPTLMAHVGSLSEPEKRHIMRADLALAKAGINPIVLGPKEGLAIVNGTAPSAALAALAVHDSVLQAALSQVLTAMSVEALQGTDESFDPFFAQVRPHSGQRDAAHNIYHFLHGSCFVQQNDGKEDFSLRQDRYSIRTASQWIGPVLEDFLLSYDQIKVELNSVTDNPLVNTTNGKILHGGNFQARTVTSAMEKVRQGLQTIGRMLYVQCTELINPATNRGLPPNLVIDEPSESYIWKGTDIFTAALMSELGFLANPVGTHVQSAEMFNQALNSVALISCRYTLSSLDVLSQLLAAHLIALCQALDLRALNHRFLESFSKRFRQVFWLHFERFDSTPDKLEHLKVVIWTSFTRQLDDNTSVDSTKRFINAVESLQPIILHSLPISVELLEAVKEWTAECSEQAFDVYNVTKRQCRMHPDAGPLLGRASRRMYRFVRYELEIPFYGEDEITTPPPESSFYNEPSETGINNMPPTVGSYITIVYDAIRTGALFEPVVECFREVRLTSQLDNLQFAGNPDLEIAKLL